MVSKIFAGFFCLAGFVNAQAQAQEVYEEQKSPIETSYLDSKEELKDYILDTGDSLDISVNNLPELSGEFTIDEQGEINLNRLNSTYVRGLSIIELTQLLEKRYKEFLINPDIYIRVSAFKPIRVAVKGEVRQPGVIRFPAFISIGKIGGDKNAASDTETSKELTKKKKLNSFKDDYAGIFNKAKIQNEYLTTLSKAIEKAGGLTSFSDISKIEVIRDVPISQGGGKKRTIINFLSYITEADDTNDIRVFNGDYIFIPSLSKKDPNIVPRSILSGLSPRFINVSILGEIETPGEVQIPIEGTLSDVMNLSGPRKPLSGKVYLIRYNQDGTILRRSINYSANATPGSRKNPYLVSGDLITVKTNIFKKASGTLTSVTEPFVGIYSTKQVIKGIID